MGIREESRSEVEVRVGKFKNGEAASKDEATGEMIKGRSERVMEWIWSVFNIAFESGVLPEDWRSAMNISLYKGKG